MPIAIRQNGLALGHMKLEDIDLIVSAGGCVWRHGSARSEHALLAADYPFEVRCVCSTPSGSMRSCDGMSC